MAFISKRLKSFRSVTNRNGAKRQKRQAGRADHARSGSTSTHLMGVGKCENPQGNPSDKSGLPQPAQRTILFPLPD